MGIPFASLGSVKTNQSDSCLVCRCRVCSQILPSFCKLSNEFKNLTFIYADIDECPETTQSIRYTPTIFIEMEKGLMRCLAQERRDYMTGFGCILDAYLSLASALTVLMNRLCECDLYFVFSIITSNRVLL
jgi:hypothetical protein